MKPKIADCTATILCGGLSKRMGFDKAFLTIDGQRLLQHNVDCLKKVFESVSLVTNDKNKFAEKNGFSKGEIWEDHYIEKGPLGGICTALEEATTDWIFISACDMPAINLSLIKNMATKRKNVQVVVCKNQGRLEPLFAFYQQSCLKVFQEQLKLGELRPRKAFDQLNVQVIQDIPISSETFINLNTPEEVKKWQSRNK